MAGADEQASIPEAHRIARLVRPTPEEFFEQYYLPERPVIIEGALHDWPCQRWSVAHLRDRIGARKHVFHYEDDRQLEMTVAEYLDVAFGDGSMAFPDVPSATERRPYMRHFGPLEGDFEAEYPIASLFPARDDLRFLSYLFCGVPATKTNCHFDWSHNFVGVVRGQKHVTLLPPGAEQFMTLDDETRKVMGRGNCEHFADPPSLRLDRGPLGPGESRMHEHPILGSCPELYYAPLHAGDLVFFPAYWYHYFHNVEASVTVTTQSRRV